MPFSLINRLDEIPLAVVDVETTGCSSEYGDRVIEVGLVRIERGQVFMTYQRLIDPRRRIAPGITALTGISPAMVAGQPTFAQQIPQLLPLLEGAVIVGHNVRFDLSFLTREFALAGVDLQQHLASPPVLDTVRMARKMFGRGGNSLQNLARRLGLQPSGAHRVLADAQTTAKLMAALLEPLGGWRMCLCDVMKAQGGAMHMAAGRRESLLPLELQEALDLRSVVSMEYVDARGVVTTRQIEPRDIRRHGPDFTLIAFCHMRQELRTFKVDRIVRLKRLDVDTAGSSLAGALPALMPGPGDEMACPTETPSPANTAMSDESFPQEPMEIQPHQEGLGLNNPAGPSPSAGGSSATGKSRRPRLTAVRRTPRPPKSH